jgi:hypothetical protein
MSAATQFDLSRDQILDRYDLRIQSGDRTKLSREERDHLALMLVDRLVELNRRARMTKRRSRRCVRLRRCCWSGAATGSVPGGSVALWSSLSGIGRSLIALCPILLPLTSFSVLFSVPAYCHKTRCFKPLLGLLSCSTIPNATISVILRL